MGNSYADRIVPMTLSEVSLLLLFVLCVLVAFSLEEDVPPPDSPPEPNPEERNLVIQPMTEEVVAFDTADYRLLPAGRRFLERQFRDARAGGQSVLERLHDSSEQRITVVGQADPRPLRGKPYDNSGLSALRACAVRQFLVDSLTIDPSQVLALGLGAQWLPQRQAGEEDDAYYRRCRRILIMSTRDAGLMERLRSIP